MSNLVEFVEWTDEAAKDLERRAERAKGSKWWKMSVGINEFRILPARADFGLRDPIYVSIEHLINPAVFPVPGQDDGRMFGFQCPRSTGGSCPLCDFHDLLEATGGSAELRDAIKTQLRYYVNIIDMNELELGPQRASLPAGVYRNIMATREMNGDFSHPLTGYTLRIKRTGTGLRDTRYSSPVAGQRGELENWREHLAAAENPMTFSRVLTTEMRDNIEIAIAMHSNSSQAPRPATRQISSSASRPSVTAQSSLDPNETY